jgi:hypothetical protein
MFVDPENGDYRFKEGSPALMLGIAPLEKYGIQEPCGLQSEYQHLDPGGPVAAARAARRKLAEKSARKAAAEEAAKREAILSATAPMTIESEGSLDVVAEYNVNEKRDIYVVFLESGERYAEARQTVEAGTSEINLSLLLSEYPDKKSDDFRYVVMILPVGKTWREALHVYRITGVTVR